MHRERGEGSTFIEVMRPFIEVMRPFLEVMRSFIEVMRSFIESVGRGVHLLMGGHLLMVSIHK